MEGQFVLFVFIIVIKTTDLPVETAHSTFTEVMTAWYC